uniref:Uncharacterized protein n=1 Tax=Arundo donax TaxID=35708 RepID=A0A0A9B668_ARUDO
MLAHNGKRRDVYLVSCHKCFLKQGI